MATILGPEALVRKHPGGDGEPALSPPCLESPIKASRSWLQLIFTERSYPLHHQHGNGTRLVQRASPASAYKLELLNQHAGPRQPPEGAASRYRSLGHERLRRNLGR